MIYRKFHKYTARGWNEILTCRDSRTVKYRVPVVRVSDTDGFGPVSPNKPPSVKRPRPPTVDVSLCRSLLLKPYTVRSPMEYLSGSVLFFSSFFHPSDAVSYFPRDRKRNRFNFLTQSFLTQSNKICVW